VGKELELSCQLNIQPLSRCLQNREGPDNAVVVADVLCSSSSELVEGEHKATH